MAANPLTDSDRLALRDQLVSERDRATIQLAALMRTFDELVDAADLEPPDDEHDPDGTTAYERAQVSSIAEATRTRLAQLDKAMSRIDAKDYGRCERCKRPIGLERLQALAGTSLCVTCAAAGVPDPTSTESTR